MHISLLPILSTLLTLITIATAKSSPHPPGSPALIPRTTAIIAYQAAATPNSPSVPLATLSYNPTHPRSNPHISDFSPPTPYGKAFGRDSLFRIGLLDEKTGKLSEEKPWSAVRLDVFRPELKGRFRVRMVDADAEASVAPPSSSEGGEEVQQVPWSVEYSAADEGGFIAGGGGREVTDKNRKEEEAKKEAAAKKLKEMGGNVPDVEVVRDVLAPRPVLNRPIVLNPEGKVQADVPEKSLLQKYWWVLAAVAMFAIMGGGGEK
ncbi:hypothetical protein MMC25_000270 [Agyrium rufum]|nr:hypothetical protein [Agyrium rufum]